MYVKNTEQINALDKVIETIKSPSDELFISVENKRCFRELENIKGICSKDDVCVIGSLSSLGINESEIVNQLEWFISHSIMLVINNISTTYEYGIVQPMNKAILNTLKQSILNSNANIINMPLNKKTNAGRTKLDFPDNWDELYEKWESKEITSKDFIFMSGLKKATFYNLLTEYKELQELNNQYIKKYMIG